MQSTFFVTQAGCSPTPTDAGDALWFCQHFYGMLCTVQPSWTAVTSAEEPRMHSGDNCYAPDPYGVDIAGTTCVGGPCKIGNYPVSTNGGLSNLVCECP